MCSLPLLLVGVPAVHVPTTTAAMRKRREPRALCERPVLVVIIIIIIITSKGTQGLPGSGSLPLPAAHSFRFTTVGLQDSLGGTGKGDGRTDGRLAKGRKVNETKQV